MTLEQKITQQSETINTITTQLSELEQQTTEQAIETDYLLSLLRLGL